MARKMARRTLTERQKASRKSKELFAEQDLTKTTTTATDQAG